MTLFAKAKEIVSIFTKNGFVAYFAGGWVRDFLLQTPSDDIDIVTNASTDQIQALFQKTIPVGVQFGIVIVVYKEAQFEVATFREEGKYIDGRRFEGFTPTCEKKDAFRRDFTINGMFYNPLTDQIIDYVGGKKDILGKCIRAIGDPDARIEEDKLRMLRALRYAARFGFTIETKTAQAIFDHMYTLFPSVSIERVWQELYKMSIYPGFEKALQLLNTFDFLPLIFPHLHSLSSKELSEYTAHIAQTPHLLPTPARFFPLFSMLKKEEIETVALAHKFSKKDKELLIYMCDMHEMFHNPDTDKATYVSFFAHPMFWLAFGCVELLGISKAQKAYIEHLHVTLFSFIERKKRNNPILQAKDLIELGIPPSKKLGVLLQRAEILSINEEIEEKAILLDRLQEDPLWES